jgi:serine/threonine protein kinase
VDTGSSALSGGSRHSRRWGPASAPTNGRPPGIITAPSKAQAPRTYRQWSAEGTSSTKVPTESAPLGGAPDASWRPHARWPASSSREKRAVGYLARSHRVKFLRDGRCSCHGGEVSSLDMLDRTICDASELMESGSATIGPYTLGSLVGRGAVTLVYEARSSPTTEPVALAVLVEDLLPPSENVSALAALESLRRLNHELLVSPRDFGVDGERVWVTCQLVSCPSLRERMRAGGPLSGDELARVLTGVASALDQAHGAGLVHGLVTLDRIHVCPTGAVFLRGFDLGWAFRRALAESGEPSYGVGNPRPLSPEQVREESPGPRSDQYQLGMVAYEATTGEHPFEGEPLRQMRAKLLEGPRSADSIPMSLRDPFTRCLAPQPQDRWPSCRHFVDALASAGRAD